MTSNLIRGRLWRENVALYLGMVTGLEVAMKPVQKLSEAVLDTDQRDIRGAGLDNWFLATRAEQTRDLSGALDRAERDAKESGRLAAVVFHRPGRRTGESFVVLSLDSLATIISEQAKES